MFSWDYAINCNENGDKNEKDHKYLEIWILFISSFPFNRITFFETALLTNLSNVKENICLVQKLITRVAV